MLVSKARIVYISIVLVERFDFVRVKFFLLVVQGVVLSRGYLGFGLCFVFRESVSHDNKARVLYIHKHVEPRCRAQYSCKSSDAVRLIMII